MAIVGQRPFQAMPTQCPTWRAEQVVVAECATEVALHPQFSTNPKLSAVSRRIFDFEIRAFRDPLLWLPHPAGVFEPASPDLYFVRQKLILLWGSCVLSLETHFVSLQCLFS